MRCVIAHHSGVFLCAAILAQSRCNVAAVIFEVTEQDVVLEVDGVVANIALPDHVQHLWPDRLMILFVGIGDSWFETQSHSEPFHFESVLIKLDSAPKLVLRERSFKETSSSDSEGTAQVRLHI